MRIKSKFFDISLFNTSSPFLKVFLLINNTTVGWLSFYHHALSADYCELHIYIKPKFRKQWLTKELAMIVKSTSIQLLRARHKITVYTTALHKESPRLLAFFGFQNYNLNYYFLNL